MTTDDAELHSWGFLEAEHRDRTLSKSSPHNPLMHTPTGGLVQPHCLAQLRRSEQLTRACLHTDLIAGSRRGREDEFCTGTWSRSALSADMANEGLQKCRNAAWVAKAYNGSRSITLLFAWVVARRRACDPCICTPPHCTGLARRNSPWLSARRVDRWTLFVLPAQSTLYFSP